MALCDHEASTAYRYETGITPISKRTRLSDSSTSTAATSHEDEVEVFVSHATSVREEDVSEEGIVVKFRFDTVRKTKKHILEELVPRLENPSTDIIIESENLVSVKDYDALYEALLRGKDRLFGFHMRLIHGKIQIYETPSVVHESTSDRITANVNFYNYDHYQSKYEPLSSQRSTKYVFDGVRLEPDCSYTNSRIPDGVRAYDSAHNQQPTIVVEVKYTESYASAFRTVPVYFQFEQVQVVIIICLSRSTVGERKINQMHAVLYRRHVSTEYADQVISFGHELHPHTKTAISMHSHVPDERYTGYGVSNEYEPCREPHMPTYKLVIPSVDVWFGVPEDIEHEDHDLEIDLYDIRQGLQSLGRAL